MPKELKIPKDILTLEFGIELSDSQKHQFTKWMAALNHQWNLGLAALEEFDRFYWFDKIGKKPALVCPIAEGSWIKEEKRVAQTCSLITEPEPFISSPSMKMGGVCLGTMAREDVIISRSNNPDNANALIEVPSKFRTGMLCFLETSWQGYVGDRKNKGKPKYKSRRETDRCNTLTSSNLEFTIDGETLKGIPKIGAVRIPGLDRRWKDTRSEIPKVCTIKIIRRCDKFRVQLSGELHRRYKSKPSDKSIGFDLGFIYAEASSTGERTPLFSASEEKMETQKVKLQKQLDAKLDSRLILWLHHPDTDFEAIKNLIRISEKNWELMRQCRTAGDIAKIIGQKRDKRYQSLRHKLPRSKAEKELRKAIAILDRRMAATRKVRDSKFATRVVKKYGHVAIENGLQRLELRERPEVVANDENGFDQNGAERQSAINKQMRSLAPGQKISILEARAKRYGRSFSKVEAPTTSAECPVCGKMNKPGLKLEASGNRDYICTCGWRCDQDIHAAVNIELRAFAFTPQVQLTPLAESARVRSYQLEARHGLPIKPLWRNESRIPQGKVDPRANQSNGSGDTEQRKTRKRNPLTPASRRNQMKALDWKEPRTVQ